MTRNVKGVATQATAMGNPISKPAMVNLTVADPDIVNPNPVLVWGHNILFETDVTLNNLLVDHLRNLQQFMSIVEAAHVFHIISKMLLILCDGEFFDNTIDAFGPLWGEALSLVLFLFFAGHFENPDKVARMQWGQSNNFWDFGPIRISC